MKKTLILLSLFFLSSCAWIINGRYEELSFDSNVEEVDIYIQNQKVCSTPCITEVKRENKMILIIAKKQGYEDKVIEINKGINVVSFLNFLTTPIGLSSLTTDVSAGAVWEYQPNVFYVLMQTPPKTQAEKINRQTENNIRAFILKNYSELKTDIYATSQEYVNELAHMSHLSPSTVSILVRDSNSESKLIDSILKKRTQ